MKSKLAVLGTAVIACLGANCARTDAPAATNEPAASTDAQSDVLALRIPTTNPGVEVRHAGRALVAALGYGKSARAIARLPESADRPFELTSAHDPSFNVRVSMSSSAAAAATVDQGLVHYAGALGADTEIMHRLSADGTEDYARFERAPAKTEIHYRVDLGTAVKHVRLLQNSVEFLDHDGAPRLRMNAPYGIDAEGKTFSATTTVEGCATDTDPRAPWGRDVVSPGSSTCDVVVRWGAVSYPATVDPAWTSAASMAQTNISHEMLMAKLTGGKVLVVNAGLSTQLFDPATDTWANTGAPSNSGHRARITAVGGDMAVQGYGGVLSTYSLANGTWADTAAPGGTDANGLTVTYMGGTSVLLVEASGRTRIFDVGNQGFTEKANGNSTVGCNPALFPLGNDKFALNGCSINTLRVYDSAADTWAAGPAGATVAGDQNCGAAFLLGSGKLLSYSRDGLVKLVDVANGTSVAVATPGTYFATQYLCARTADVSMGGGKYLFAGGRFTYDENANSITDNGVFPSGAQFHGAIVKLNDGRYLGAGGNASFAAYNSVDIYGPSGAADCTMATPVFDAAKNKCFACDGDNGGATTYPCSTAAAPACQTGNGNALLGQCTECSATAAALCVGTKPLCDTSKGSCAACNGGFGSGTTLACKVGTAPACAADGSCKAANGDKGTNATAPCPTAANPMVKADGSCGKCTTNADCAGATHAGPICNATSGACGTTCASDADCGGTQYCDTTAKTCTPKKADGATCVTPAECTSAKCTGGKCGAPVATDAGTSSSGGKDGGTSSGAVDSGASSSGAVDSGTSSSSSGSANGNAEGGGCGCNESRSTGVNGLMAFVMSAIVLGIRRRKETRTAR